MLNQLLITFGSYLHKIHIDFDCLLNLIIDVDNNTQLKSTIMQGNLNYFEIDSICESHVDSGNFSHVIAFLLDDRNSIRHVTLILSWYIKIFESIKDTNLLVNILSSFKHCTELTSIVVCPCIISSDSSNNKKVIYTGNDFHKWLNDNTYPILEQKFNVEYDNNNKMLKLWL